MKKYPQCLLCFLDDDFQSELRAAAQSLAPLFENAISVYARQFQDILGKLGSVSGCPSHKQESEHFTWWIDTALEVARRVNVRTIFREMHAAYLASITGRFGESFDVVAKLMTVLGIEGANPDRLDKVLFFRGRKGRLGREEMYHVPFSKRYCVTNQRYSVTGQPLLYLGLSIVDVAYEIGADPNTIGDCCFSSFYLRDPERLRVLDLGNALYGNLWNVIRPIAGAGSQLKSMAVEGGLPENERRSVEARFTAFVVAALCSFRRKAFTPQDAFAPEYVLPQTIAHWSRDHGFDGILYASTRVDTSKWRMRGGLQLSRYRENLALFTNYKSEDANEHDQALLSLFDISPPLQLADVREVPEDVIAAYRGQIVNLPHSRSPTDRIRSAAIDVDTAFEGLVLKDSGGHDTPYAQTSCGRIQRYLQFLFMMSRLVESGSSNTS